MYAGANPPEVENLITQKIEDKLDGVDGVKQMTSSSNESYSNIFLEFDPSVNSEDALRRVKDKVDQAKGDLPLDAEEPITQELNFNIDTDRQYRAVLGLRSGALEALADNLKDRMAKIPGVLEAKVQGKQDKEIAIDVDPALLRQYGLTLSDISKAVSTQHTNVPGGTMITSGFRFSIKVTGELTDPDQFNDLIVRSVNDKMIRDQGRGACRVHLHARPAVDLAHQRQTVAYLDSCETDGRGHRAHRGRGEENHRRGKSRIGPRARITKSPTTCRKTSGRWWMNCRTTCSWASSSCFWC